MDAVLHVIGHLVLMEKYDLVCYTRQYNFSGIRASRYPINIPYTHYTGLIRIPNNQCFFAEVNSVTLLSLVTRRLFLSPSTYYYLSV